MTEVVTLDDIVALCKRRGSIFPASEIYGGFANTYDYGHSRSPAEEQREGRVVAGDDSGA